MNQINKKINFLYYFSILFFVTTCFYIWNSNNTSKAGLNIGTPRIISVLSPNLGCPLQPPSPNLCLCGTMDTILSYTAGGQGHSLCVPPGMPTSGPPITPSSVGYQLLGNFSQAIPAAMPIGIVGTSF